MKSATRLVVVLVALVGMLLPGQVNADCDGGMVICGTGSNWCNCYSAPLSYIDGQGRCHYGPFEQISGC
jgi:hypothetical protein